MEKISNFHHIKLEIMISKIKPFLYFASGIYWFGWLSTTPFNTQTSTWWCKWSLCHHDVSLSHPTKHNNIYTMTFSKPFRKTYFATKSNRVHSMLERKRETERERERERKKERETASKHYKTFIKIIVLNILKNFCQ